MEMNTIYGHCAVLKELQEKNWKLVKQNRLLKRQLELPQVCRNCMEFKRERDFLFRKCKNYERQLEQIENRDGKVGQNEDPNSVVLEDAEKENETHQEADVGYLVSNLAIEVVTFCRFICQRDEVQGQEVEETPQTEDVASVAIPQLESENTTLNIKSQNPETVLENCAGDEIPEVNDDDRSIMQFHEYIETRYEWEYEAYEEENPEPLQTTTEKIGDEDVNTTLMETPTDAVILPLVPAGGNLELERDLEAHHIGGGLLVVAVPERDNRERQHFARKRNLDKPTDSVRKRVRFEERDQVIPSGHGGVTVREEDGEDGAFGSGGPGTPLDSDLTIARIEREEEEPVVWPRRKESHSRRAFLKFFFGGGGPSSSSSEDDTDVPCDVCGRKAIGRNYLCNSCDACRTFFCRTVKKGIVHTCINGGRCVVGRDKRWMCKACRFNKCLAAGMTPEILGTRSGRTYSVPCPVILGSRTGRLAITSTAVGDDDLPELEVFTASARKRKIDFYRRE